MNFRAWIPTERRTLVASIAALGLLVAVVVWALPSGGGDASPTGASVPGTIQTSGKPAATGSPVAPSRATVKSRPPARLFAGSSSAPGMLVRVCDGGDCTTLPQGVPPTVETKSGGLLTFTLAGHPTHAWAEIRGLPSGAPARQDLTPSSLMLWPSQVAPGRYVLTLNAKFESSEARWVFGLRVTR